MLAEKIRSFKMIFYHLRQSHTSKCFLSKGLLRQSHTSKGFFIHTDKTYSLSNYVSKLCCISDAQYFRFRINGSTKTIESLSFACLSIIPRQHLGRLPLPRSSGARTAEHDGACVSMRTSKLRCDSCFQMGLFDQNFAGVWFELDERFLSYSYQSKSIVRSWPGAYRQVS